MDPMEWDQLNVINAAKAWYRGIMRGYHPRAVTAREMVRNGLPPSLRRLAHMVENLLETERKRGPKTVPAPPKKKTKARDHLRVVK